MSTLQMVGRIILLVCILVMIICELWRAKILYDHRMWDKNNYLKLLAEGHIVSAMYVYRNSIPKPATRYIDTTYWSCLWEVLTVDFKQEDDTNLFFDDEVETEETSYRYIREKYGKGV